MADDPTTDVVTLRKAARAMRAVAAEAAKPENSHPYGDKMFPAATSPKAYADMMREYLGGPWGEQAAAWHPAVALLVADWLEADAGVIERHGLDGKVSMAHDVAVAYLAEDIPPVVHATTEPTA